MCDKNGQYRYGVQGQVKDLSVAFEVKEICPHQPARLELRIIRPQILAFRINACFDLQRITLQGKVPYGLGHPSDKIVASKHIDQMCVKRFGQRFGGFDILNQLSVPGIHHGIKELQKSHRIKMEKIHLPYRERPGDR